MFASSLGNKNKDVLNYQSLQLSLQFTNKTVLKFKNSL